MYSRDERMKAVKLYIKYDGCAGDVARELGYPDPKSLVSWYEAYLEEQETGVLWEECSQNSPKLQHVARLGRKYNPEVTILLRDPV